MDPSNMCKPSTSTLWQGYMCSIKTMPSLLPRLDRQQLAPWPDDRPQYLRQRHIVPHGKAAPLSQQVRDCWNWTNQNWVGSWMSRACLWKSSWFKHLEPSTPIAERISLSNPFLNGPLFQARSKFILMDRIHTTTTHQNPESPVFSDLLN